MELRLLKYFYTIAEKAPSPRGGSVAHHPTDASAAS